ncbi:hypothetical protein ASH00_14415 [Arthrobacter sp. Soil782]|uniref:hypothetical protein n=1 Tax=Arthrobacter sp. Soil782 TaxID=1736410 RepID=UPI0006F2EB5D|nr:hypothetical protein [Arthrobacter sp. Soil782]KRF04295.1 hypothetical protein ASH00_14415 [Arthrobacter sp. Soil782]
MRLTCGKEGGDFHLQPVISLLDVAAHAPDSLTDEKTEEFMRRFLDIEQVLETEARRSEGGQDY